MCHDEFMYEGRNNGCQFPCCLHSLNKIFNYISNLYGGIIQIEKMLLTKPITTSMINMFV